MEYTREDIKKSRKAALNKICEFLQAEDVEAQFDGRIANYHSEDKFIVTWIGNWQGIPSEYGIDKTDAFYSDYSGYKAIYVTRSLFHEKQLSGYSTIERALLEVGMKLCTMSELREFYNKYVTPYNERIKIKSTENQLIE